MSGLRAEKSRKAITFDLDTTITGLRRHYPGKNWRKAYSDIKKFMEDFVRHTQPELFGILRRMFKSDALYSKWNYILVPGEAPIMLLAHLDTVHKEPVRLICKSDNGNILMSPTGIGGDDRCGVYGR